MHPCNSNRINDVQSISDNSLKEKDGSFPLHWILYYQFDSSGFIQKQNSIGQ
jgi:hypothetical protein